MEHDSGVKLRVMRVDGGASEDSFLVGCLGEL